MAGWFVSISQGYLRKVLTNQVHRSSTMRIRYFLGSQIWQKCSSWLERNTIICGHCLPVSWLIVIHVHIRIISKAWCKTAVIPLLTHWSYCSLALSHRYAGYCRRKIYLGSKCIAVGVMFEHAHKNLIVHFNYVDSRSVMLKGLISTTVRYYFTHTIISFIFDPVTANPTILGISSFPALTQIKYTKVYRVKALTSSIDPCNSH